MFVHVLQKSKIKTLRAFEQRALALSDKHEYQSPKAREAFVEEVASQLFVDFYSSSIIPPRVAIRRDKEWGLRKVPGKKEVLLFHAIKSEKKKKNID